MAAPRRYATHGKILFSPQKTNLFLSLLFFMLTKLGFHFIFDFEFTFFC